MKPALPFSKTMNWRALSKKRLRPSPCQQARETSSRVTGLESSKQSKKTDDSILRRSSSFCEPALIRVLRAYYYNVDMMSYCQLNGNQE